MIAIPSGGRLTGVVAAVAFNKILLNVTFGDASRLPRRGELAINTLAAQRALDRQSAALDAVLYDRAESERLKGIIIDPRTAEPVEEVEDVVPTSGDFDEEKRRFWPKRSACRTSSQSWALPGRGKRSDRGNRGAMAEAPSRPQDPAVLADPHSPRQRAAADHRDGLAAQMIRIGRSDETRIFTAQITFAAFRIFEWEEALFRVGARTARPMRGEPGPE